MKTYGGVDVQIDIFLTSALVGGEWSASRPCRFTPEERVTSTHWIGGWVGPRAGLDYLEKRKFLTLPGLELRPLGRPARSQSLYRLSYPGSYDNPGGDIYIDLPCCSFLKCSQSLKISYAHYKTITAPINEKHNRLIR
jgi:hypothetical protein